MGKNTLLVHIMENRKEVGRTKTKTYNDSIKWKQRLWAISQQAREKGYIVDRKGITHLYIDVNLADKIYYFLSPTELNLFDFAGKPIDKCGECGGNISIDAQAVRSLVNKGNIVSFWGRDNSYVLLLMILGIVAVILTGALFYMIGENQKTNELLKQYLQPPPNVVSSKFLLGVLHG